MDKQAYIEKFVSSEQLPPRNELYQQALERVYLLKKPDRCFMELYLLHGLSIREIAGLTGQSRLVTTSKVCRIIKAITGNRYLLIYARREKLTQLELDLAYDSIILALGYRSLSMKYNISQHKVRSILRKLAKITTTEKSRNQHL
ncbi:MAG: hypothetical protein JW745_05400 [Sedimentisphaerales bacterium]|nr:hypothetical protein [Sedimentisphaerales bacterium]MBN2842314.1 hypothetical protein [Sedimentisphaerales bacterium]